MRKQREKINTIEKHLENLMEVNGKTINKQLLKRWTPIAIECYKRGCNCNGCDIVPKESFHEKCNVKYYVEGYFKIGKEL